MNNLKNIMALRRITAKELAKRSGVAVSLIRRTMNDPQVTPRQKTAEKLAGALGCNCAQIYATQPAAANDMELLTKRVDDAAQALVRALGEYSKTPIYSALTISTGNADYKSSYSIHAQTLDGAEVLALNVALSFNELGALEYWERLEI